MSGCSAACGWCGACGSALDCDYLDATCAECGAGPDEPHDEDCGQDDERDEDDDTLTQQEQE